LDDAFTNLCRARYVNLVILSKTRAWQTLEVSSEGFYLSLNVLVKALLI
jgi:hypothetical protein